MVKKNYKYYMYLFIIFSFLGFMIEVFYSYVFRNKFVIPGTTSPFCPIDGIGVISMVILLKKIKKNKAKLFFGSFLIGSFIEYSASYISEKFYNNIIWDYSNYFFNIDGRICFLYSFMWGIIGTLLVGYLEPLLKKLYNKYMTNISDFVIFLMAIWLVIIIIMKNI